MTPPAYKLELYSHGVRVSAYTTDTYKHIASFLATLTLEEEVFVPGRGHVMEVKKRFYGLTHDHKEVFLHRHHLDEFQAWMAGRGFTEETVEMDNIPLPVPADSAFKVKDHISPRDSQIPIVNSLLEPGALSRAIKLQTGGGKTLTTLMALARRGVRFAVMLPPKYFGLWEEGFWRDCENVEGNLIKLAGSDTLKGAMHKAVNGEFDWDIVMISQSTYRNYIETYERFGLQGMLDAGYPFPPYRFHEIMGIGAQVCDEFQEDPGLVFRIELYSNVPHQIKLSATPYTGDPFVTRMIQVMAPKEEDTPLPDLDVYINVIALLYSDNVKPKDYLVPVKKMYNHSRYEKKMLEKPRRLDQYIKNLVRAIKGLYVKDRQPGQKMLILCAYVEFITHLTKRLKVAFPELKVVSYVSGSSYQKVLESDIVVSTIKSSGTGVDFPNLREVLLCQATDSEKDNIQILGRPRRLKDYPDVNPRLTYLVCTNIPKHIKYHQSKTKYFNNRVLSHRTMRL